MSRLDIDNPDLFPVDKLDFNEALAHALRLIVRAMESTDDELREAADEVASFMSIWCPDDNPLKEQLGAFFSGELDMHDADKFPAQRAKLGAFLAELERYTFDAEEEWRRKHGNA